MPSLLHWHPTIATNFLNRTRRGTYPQTHGRTGGFPVGRVTWPLGRLRACGWPAAAAAAAMGRRTLVVVGAGTADRTHGHGHRPGARLLLGPTQQALLGLPPPGCGPHRPWGRAPQRIPCRRKPGHRRSLASRRSGTAGSRPPPGCLLPAARGHCCGVAGRGASACPARAWSQGTGATAARAAWPPATGHGEDEVIVSQWRFGRMD